LLGDLVNIGLVRLGSDQEPGVAALGAVGLFPEATDRQQFARRREVARDGYLGADKAAGYQ
jgi:hypothetical protein